MRRVAREDVFKLVFEYTFYGTRNDGTLELMLLDNDLDDDDKQYIKDVYQGVIQNVDNLNETISSHLDSYRLERLNRPEYAALLIAVYEYNMRIAPVPVIVSEAVSICKKYGTEKSGSFVNGVLAKIVNEAK